ncbi:MAG: hypothetical protein CEN90_426 [Parcubacteria group bacterium Licking1014_17]|nr:MAG: hypothetical protein CEN90_426 [Parcubacteria group bacterium Licking1014_17]
MGRNFGRNGRGRRDKPSKEEKKLSSVRVSTARIKKVMEGAISKGLPKGMLPADRRQAVRKITGEVVAALFE